MQIKHLNRERIERSLSLLGGLLDAEQGESFQLIVCGGAALRMMELHSRTTDDVDVLALADSNDGGLISPAPFPTALIRNSLIVAEEMNLASDWLNNGPSSGVGGLFQLGLPKGLENRLSHFRYSQRLGVSYISRIDQIHLKLYASIDQPGSYHASDLISLNPSSSELQMAINWALTHDNSLGFREVAKGFLRSLGALEVANAL